MHCVYDDADGGRSILNTTVVSVKHSNVCFTTLDHRDLLPPDAHTYTRTYKHTHIHTYTRTYKHTHIHTYTCMYKHTHIHTHIHTHAPTQNKCAPLHYAAWFGRNDSALAILFSKADVDIRDKVHTKRLVEHPKRPIYICTEFTDKE